MTLRYYYKLCSVKEKLASGVPPCLKVHFSQVKMHAIVLEDTLRTILGSRVVGPRHSSIELVKMLLLDTHWRNLLWTKVKVILLLVVVHFP
jgi:hypothetical protein